MVNNPCEILCRWTTVCQVFLYIYCIFMLFVQKVEFYQLMEYFGFVVLDH